MLILFLFPMLTLESLLETPSFSLAYDAPLRGLYVTWRGPHDANSSVTNCALILQYVRVTHARRILNDSSLALDGWSEVTGWLAQAFLPSLADNGVVALAWVKAQDWPTRIAIEQTLHDTSYLLVDTFEDTCEALAWLHATS